MNLHDLQEDANSFWNTEVWQSLLSFLGDTGVDLRIKNCSITINDSNKILEICGQGNQDIPLSLNKSLEKPNESAS